MLHEK